MRTLVILFSVLALEAAAKTYKGTESVTVGKKTFKCKLSIAYNTSPAKCGKATAKCKPMPKKPIKFSVGTDDATLSFSVSKNKVKACKVEASGGGVSPSPGGGSSPSPGGGASSPSPGGGGSSPSPGGGGSSPSPGPFTFPPIVSPGPGNSENMNCNCRLPLMQQPPSIAMRNLDLGHAIAGMLVSAKDRAKPEKPAAVAVKRTFTLPALPTIPADLTSLIPVLLIAFVSAIIGILKGMLLSSVVGALPIGRSLVEGKDEEQARILSKLLDRQGIDGILGGLLGGGNGGGGDNGGLLGALLGGGAGGGNGGFEEAIMSTLLQNMIDQIIANPESLQEMITLAVDSGLAEQVITNLIESGDIEALVQSLVDSGAGPDIIGNLGNGLLQELLGNNELGNLNIDDLTQMLEGALNEMGGVGSILAGVDAQNMELNMQCSCIKEEPPIFPLPGK